MIFLLFLLLPLLLSPGMLLVWMLNNKDYSDLSHRLPRVEAEAEIMQGTSNLHHLIAGSGLEQATDLFDDATAFDTTVDMLNANPTRGNALIVGFLLGG